MANSKDLLAYRNRHAFLMSLAENDMFVSDSAFIIMYIEQHPEFSHDDKLSFIADVLTNYDAPRGIEQSVYDLITTFEAKPETIEVPILFYMDGKKIKFEDEIPIDKNGSKHKFTLQFEGDVTKEELKDYVKKRWHKTGALSNSTRIKHSKRDHIIWQMHLRGEKDKAIYERLIEEGYYVDLPNIRSRISEIKKSRRLPNMDNDIKRYYKLLKESTKS